MDMDREIDTSMITEEQMIQIRRNAEEDIKLDDMKKARALKAKKARVRRAEIEAIYKSHGLTKVRGAVSGKTYWE